MIEIVAIWCRDHNDVQWLEQELTNLGLKLVWDSQVNKTSSLLVACLTKWFIIENSRVFSVALLNNTTILMCLFEWWKIPVLMVDYRPADFRNPETREKNLLKLIEAINKFVAK